MVGSNTGLLLAEDQSIAEGTDRENFLFALFSLDLDPYLDLGDWEYHGNGLSESSEGGSGQWKRRNFYHANDSTVMLALGSA